MKSKNYRDDSDISRQPSMSDIEKRDASKEHDRDSLSIALPSRAPSNHDVEHGDTEKETNDETQQPKFDDWDGPDDPDNPENWPLWIKIYHSAVPAMFGFAVTFGTSVYTPAVFDIMKHFDISRTAAILGLSLYTLGLAFGPIFSAPLSEKYGRNVVYMTSSPIFMLFTLGAGFSKTFYSFLICRFFAGMSGSPALAVGAGTNSDLWPPRVRAIAASFFIMAPFAGPSLGPIIGGFVAQYKGWRWTQWCMLFFSVFCFVTALGMKETYKPIILKRRAKKRGFQPPEPEEGGVAAAGRAIVQQFVKPMHMLFTEPIVFLFSAYTAFTFAILFMLFAAFPFVFQRPPYNFTISQTGLTFISVGAGVAIGCATGIVVDRKIYMKHVYAAIAEGKTHAAPETRLYTAMYGSVGITVGLFWFAWTADKGVHWAVPVVAAVPFAWGNMSLFTSCALYLIDVYGPLNGSSAMAANGIFRYTLGAVFPLFTVQMYANLGTGWATSLLGFLSVLMLPIPFVFYKFGPQIRKASKYPTTM